MALVERLMGLETPKIPVHKFFAAQSELDAGVITVAQIKNFLNMDASAASEYDALIATAPTGTTTAQQFSRSRYIQKVHSVFLLAEDQSIPGYSTPAEVRAKLGI
jgi:hypothetical protein